VGRFLDQAERAGVRHVTYLSAYGMEHAPAEAAPQDRSGLEVTEGKALVKTPIAGLDDFAALDPFFRIIERGLDGLAGPGHFFDLLAEDAVFEYVITVPGYPRRVEGRTAVAELYRPYGDALVLDRCYDLAVHHDPAQGTVVLEYASAGKVVATGAPYGNRYISVLTLRDREVIHWRDYLDPLAVFDALGWPPR
jgi:uncharacterized protein